MRMVTVMEEVQNSTGRLLVHFLLPKFIKNRGFFLLTVWDSGRSKSMTVANTWGEV
jgi:hypothetical protein